MKRLLAVLLLACAFGVPAARAATIIIVNADGPGEGFNDPTPVVPVGGNPGVTRGAQRLFVFQTAANIWGNILSSNVTIQVSSQFNALTCDATSAVLGAAGTHALFRNFPNAEFTGTWYPGALANKQANSDLDGVTQDIDAQFNSTLDGGTCLGGETWYYGVDGNEPATQVELLPVVLHEVGHGLGFAQYGNLSTGAFFNSSPDIYQRFLFDNTVNLHWNQMTNAQRAASAINTGHVGWDGTAVKVEAPTMLGPRTEVKVVSPAGIAGNKQFALADFGASPSAALVTGQVVLANDGVAPTSDGCTALQSMTGKIALIDRGTCSFTVKGAAAQQAGAIACIVVNNVAGAPAGMGGSDPSITIPCVMISQADGNAIKAQLGTGVTMSIGPNPSFLAGADDAGRVLVYAPNPIESGSSISHWDPSAEPSLLMEPFITDGLSSGVDLTRYAFEDIGWFSPRTTDTIPSGPIALLGQSVPNPFTTTTTIAFTLASAGRADIVVFDLAGRTVKHLFGGELPAGNQTVIWDGTDDRGSKVSSGVFFYRLTAPGIEASKRMVRVTSLGG